MFGAARPRRRTAPWLQRVRIYEMGWVPETSVSLLQFKLSLCQFFPT